ncbi:MAG: sigma-70 family RNA polymerase sigma factor [Clostridiales bacterium]|nr:sigma-70 family RNA polymerase sigma factor [Clostridiales bacterium]
MPHITLESLYDANAKLVYWAVFSVLHDHDLTQDAVQNTFLSAHRNMEMLGTLSDAQCRAWLYRCAVNSGIDILRRQKRNVLTENAGENEADTAVGPEEAAEQGELRRFIHDLVHKLPKKYRDPLYLYYFAELDYHQIANILQLNEGTLKSRMSRGRAMLEARLKKEGGVYG